VTGTATRLIIVLVIVVGAAACAWLVSRFRRPPHPNIVVGDLGDRPGVVVFTSTTCGTCKAVISLLEEWSIPFREVTNELEPGQFDEWGIVAVPVTVVIDEDGQVVATFSGTPRRAAFRRAASVAGIAAT
jgi:glutaredoxin